MSRYLLVLSIVLFFVPCLNTNVSLAGQMQAIEPISSKDNILILAPHPDDETLSCAGIIQKALKAGAQVHVVYLTNGDSNQLAFIVYEKRLVFKKKEFLHMGEVRRSEAIAAMALLGLPQENLVFLGYPDFGTMMIFKNYWAADKPYRSLLTRVSSVPYAENFSFGKPYKAESILTDIKEILKKIQPNKIFVTSGVDTNADHRALYLFLRLALLDLPEGFSGKVKVFPYLIHHLKWPSPRHYHPELELLPPKNMLKPDYLWLNLDLTSREIEKKHRAVLAYKSQTESSAFYLLSFVRKNELFFKFPDTQLKKEPADNNLSWEEGFDSVDEKDGGEAEQVIREPAGDNNSAISFAQKDKNILIKISPRRQPIITSLSVYLFGYKKQTAFSLMPKIRLKIIGNNLSVLNGRQKIKMEGAGLKREGKDIIITFPLAALNEPKIIFCSVNTSSRNLSYDSNAWSVINLK